jgi:hypothetical protein
MKNHSLEHFRRPPERLNCAQSVLYAYHRASGDTTISLLDKKAFGGGRAAGGLCGALHAACTITPEKAERLKTRFAEKSGPVVCREMRRANQHPCEVCVSEAAQLLQHELGLDISEAG